MEKVLKFPAFVGRLGLCYPIKAGEGDCRNGVGIKPRWQIGMTLSKTFQFIVCLCAILFNIETWWSKASQCRGQHLSQDINLFIGYFTTVTAEVIIRLSTLYYWSSVTALVTDLGALWSLPRFVVLKSSPRTKVYVILGIIFSTACFSSRMENIYAHQISSGGKSTTDFKFFWLLPENEFLVRGTFVLFKLLTALTSFYATVFLTVLGPILLDVYNAQLRQFSGEFLGHRMESDDSPVGNDEDQEKLESCDNRESRLEIFRKEFGMMEKCFGNYLKVAGSYSLAIVIRSASAAISTLFIITNIVTADSEYRRTRELLHVGSQILPLVLILNFGTLFQETVGDLSFKTIGSTSSDSLNIILSFPGGFYKDGAEEAQQVQRSAGIHKLRRTRQVL